MHVGRASHGQAATSPGPGRPKPCLPKIPGGSGAVHSQLDSGQYPPLQLSYPYRPPGAPATAPPRAASAPTPNPSLHKPIPPGDLGGPSSPPPNFHTDRSQHPLWAVQTPAPSLLKPSPSPCGPCPCTHTCKASASSLDCSSCHLSKDHPIKDAQGVGTACRPLCLASQ